MTPFLTYLLKSSVSIALLFVLYKLTMSNDNSHKLNRYLLLGILIVSAFLPFVNLPYFQEKPVVSQVEFIHDFFVPEIQTFDFASSPIESGPILESASMHINPLLFFYLLAIIFLFMKLVISVARIFQLMKKAEKKGFQQFILLVVKEFIQPFSFLKRIFISETDYESNKKILIAHEAEHIRQRHYIDLFFLELFTFLHWFNPFMWLLKSELKLVHEYQADRAVLQKGIDTKKYQLLVLEKAVGERRFAMANYFTQKPIQKRIRMMKRNKLYRWNWFKPLLFVPIVLLLLQAFARPENKVDKTYVTITGVQQSNTLDWLKRWTVENIKNGVYQPDGLKSSEYPLGKRNILSIFLTRNDEWIIENTRVKKEDIKLGVRNFISGNNFFGDIDPVLQEKKIPLIGVVKVPKCIVRLSYDNGSSQEARNNSLKIIGEAYLEARQDKAIELFNQNYFLIDLEKRDAVEKMVPILFGYSNVIISEPEPIDIQVVSPGKVKISNQEFLFDEFESILTKANTDVKERYEKLGYEISLQVNLNTDNDVSEEKINQIKEIFRKAKIENVNYKVKD